MTRLLVKKIKDTPLSVLSMKNIKDLNRESEELTLAAILTKDQNERRDCLRAGEKIRSAVSYKLQSKGKKRNQSPKRPGSSSATKKSNRTSPKFRNSVDLDKHLKRLSCQYGVRW